MSAIFGQSWPIILTKVGFSHLFYDGLSYRVDLLIYVCRKVPLDLISKLPNYVIDSKPRK
jgi:hypothetical protein